MCVGRDEQGFASGRMGRGSLRMRKWKDPSSRYSWQRLPIQWPTTSPIDVRAIRQGGGWDEVRCWRWRCRR